MLRTAGAAGLSGWVRNRSDGTVECVAEGERSALEGLLVDLRRGPGGADVSHVDVEWEDPEGLRGFSVRG